MKFNKRIFNLSSWITLFTVLFVPAKSVQSNHGSILSYGFPIRFYTQYADKPMKGTWFFDGSHLNLASLLVNIALIYFIIMGVRLIVSKIKTYKGLRCH
ncbi:MAG: hypothetical protein GX962_01235 [Epulopiscium sp.]|nr:hypothetical protein [Candidatus Epulonipiscium sp.]